jgi:glutamate racemase
MNNGPIGIYDSGFGGLSVWRELYKALPNESLIYLGDGANCPYGNLSEEKIRLLAEKSVRRLLDCGCKMIVVACNTATAAAIEHLRAEFSSVPFVGLEPAVKPACLATRTGVVGVVATKRSLESSKFLTTLARYGEGVKVVKAVGEGFVEAVECSEEHTAATQQKVRAVIEPIIEAGADVIVLGCTHYPFLRDVIERIAGEGVEIVDSSAAVARRVAALLDENGIRAEEGAEVEYRFLTFADEAYAEKLEAKAFCGIENK